MYVVGSLWNIIHYGEANIGAGVAKITLKNNQYQFEFNGRRMGLSVVENTWSFPNANPIYLGINQSASGASKGSGVCSFTVKWLSKSYYYNADLK